MSRCRLMVVAWTALCVAASTLALAAEPKAEKKAEKDIPTVLWSDPGNISSRNLLYGIGGENDRPSEHMTFVEEDSEGTNPKFEVLDAVGTKWKAKLGLEAKPETAASRLLWAVGYFVDEDYFVPSLTVQPVPHLKRGQNLVGKDGTIADVRLKRHRKGEEKLGTWKWKHNPFTGQREFNGLRVMMALLNNWDVKDENNTVFEEQGPTRRVYMVSDLGASFGSTGYSWTRTMSKNNPRTYERSRFIRKIRKSYVDFNIPTRPALINVFDFPDFIKRVRLRWIGRHIPRADARWIGDLLARLSPDQIRDAFRSAGYSPHEVEELAATVEKRIAELQKL